MTGRPLFNILSVASNIERHKLGSDQPWLLFLDLQYPGSMDPDADQFHVRLVRNLDPVMFNAGDGLGPQSYLPFNFDMGDFKVTSNGSVPEMELTASNVMRALQGVIEDYGGAVGADLTLYVANMASPEGEPDLAMAFTVNTTACDSKLVHFTLGAASPLRKLFPLHKYRPNFCDWQYNGPALQAKKAAAVAASDTSYYDPGAQCGYVGPMTTCTKTQDGPNGCAAHFPGVPLRGLFFPGIDSNGAFVAGVA